MNAMTIILSATASLLVAALILNWQSNDEKADQDIVNYKKDLTTVNAKIRVLEEKIEAHAIALHNQKQGLPAANPYGNSVNSQIDFAKDTKSLANAKIQRSQIEDRLRANNATPEDPLVLAQNTKANSTTNNQQSSSALDLATGGSGSTSTQQPPSKKVKYDIASSEDISVDKQQERRKAIKDSRVYARVSYVKYGVDSDTLFAELAGDVHIQPNANLAVRRRQTGIAGRVRIVRIFENGGKTVLSLEPVSKGFGQASLVLKIGDELILEPKWADWQP